MILQEGAGPIVLHNLGERAVACTEDDAIMTRFVRDYLEMLDDRLGAIVSSIEARNDMSAHVAMLSLESTSVMVGETELANIVRVLRSAIARGHHTVVPALVMAMSVEAGVVQERLHAPS